MMCIDPPGVFCRRQTHSVEIWYLCNEPRDAFEVVLVSVALEQALLDLVLELLVSKS